MIVLLEMSSLMDLIWTLSYSTPRGLSCVRKIKLMQAEHFSADNFNWPPNREHCPTYYRKRDVHARPVLCFSSRHTSVCCIPELFYFAWAAAKQKCGEWWCPEQEKDCFEAFCCKRIVPLKSLILESESCLYWVTTLFITHIFLERTLFHLDYQKISQLNQIVCHAF